MNWVGGNLSYTSAKTGIYKSNATTDLDNGFGLGGRGTGRASTLARSKRQQQKHFQKTRRSRNARRWTKHAVGSDNSRGSPSTARIAGTVEFSINQGQTGIHPPSTPSRDGTMKHYAVENRPGDESMSVLELRSPTDNDDQRLNRFVELKKRLLTEDDWSALFLVDSNRRKQSNNCVKYDEQEVLQQAKLTEAKTIEDLSTKLSPPPFKLSYRSAISPLTSSSYSTQHSPLQNRRANPKTLKVLSHNVSEENESRQAYLRQIGGDNSLASECSIHPISEAGVPHGQDTEGFETSFEILDTSGSYGSRDLWKRAVGSPSTKITSRVLQENTEDIDREWRELVGRNRGKPYNDQKEDCNTSSRELAMSSPKWASVNTNVEAKIKHDWQDLCE